jgi:hypothetical protein
VTWVDFSLGRCMLGICLARYEVHASIARTGVALAVGCEFMGGKLTT